MVNLNNNILCKPIVKHFIFSIGFLLTACGGGSNGVNTAVSGQVPYLLSPPVVSIEQSSFNANNYDVTVTLEASGPVGVAFINLWITDINDPFNFTNLDLFNIPSTNLWEGNTNSFLPLSPGDYYIEQITLDDADPFVDPIIGTGWYFEDPSLSSQVYFVDETIFDSTLPAITYFNVGLSAIPITSFNLP